MSDSEDSTVTYTQVSSPFKDSSDVGSPGVDRPLVMPEDPYSYIAAAYQAPPSPRGAIDEILPAEEQLLPVAASPTADSPGYVLESDPEEEPEADDDEDPEEDPADYPVDRDDEEEEEEPSGDDADDEDEDEDEEEEHPALADSVPLVHRMNARISFRDEPSISLPLREEIPSPPLPASSPASVLPALPLPTSSPPLQLLSSDRRADRPEITLPPRKRLGIDLGPICEVGESSAAGHKADYGFVDTVDAEISRRRAEEVDYRIRDAWVDPRDVAEEVALTTLEGVNTRVTELAAVQEQDTQDIYGVIEDTQGRQTQIYQRVETLVDDSQYHYETARLLDQEALVSREAWGRSMKAANRRSQTVTSEMLQADHMRQAEIATLRTFDRTRQEQLVQTLTLTQSL
ncbi:hypothetical protein Tco_1044141 [Tanacetum coccineum]|uniref:Uncharacterized protein n=1 Tax=Tanacetum coccineum TaxID=301880 RepID=A0ABQ5GP44_9ASTR